MSNRKSEFMIEFEGTESILRVRAYTTNHARSLAINSLESQGLPYPIKIIRKINEGSTVSRQA